VWACVELTWLGHRSVMVDLHGARLLTDPVLRRFATGETLSLEVAR
jgi:L-ascorbate metabolism protein UlaG (beta-lactamase superfamily)